MNGFPAEIIAAAKAAQKETGCPASVTLAQWALESGYGKHCAAPNNYFGIKWHPKCRFGFHEVKTKECYGGKWTVISAKFIDFPTLQDAMAYHGKLLMQHPYDARTFSGDWKAFVHHIAPIYATDPKYEAKLIAIITTNHLDEYDR